MTEQKRDRFDTIASERQYFSSQSVGGLIQTIVGEGCLLRHDGQPVAVHADLLLEPLWNRLFELIIAEWNVWINGANLRCANRIPRVHSILLVDVDCQSRLGFQVMLAISPANSNQIK
jgi:hypothetical protein